MSNGGGKSRSASRRNFVRFPAICRVEYEHDGQRIVSFTHESMRV